MALYSGGRAVISNQGEADVVPIGTVTPGFFAVFKADADHRAASSPRDENLPTGPRAVVVSYGFWQERLGGRADVLSQTVEISGVPWPIVGVAPRGFDFPERRAAVDARAQQRRAVRPRLRLPERHRAARRRRDAPRRRSRRWRAIAAALERDFPTTTSTSP